MADFTDEEIAKARALCDGPVEAIAWAVESVYGDAPLEYGETGDFTVYFDAGEALDACDVLNDQHLDEEKLPGATVVELVPRDAARTLLPALLDELEAARRDLAIAHQDASQLSGDANRVLRELKERMFAKIERYERDAEALTADLAATKAALAEAVQMIEDTTIGASGFITDRLAALKAKVQP